jgi:hypothetical protein
VLMTYSGFGPDFPTAPLTISSCFSNGRHRHIADGHDRPCKPGLPPSGHCPERCCANVPCRPWSFARGRGGIRALSASSPLRPDRPCPGRCRHCRGRRQVRAGLQCPGGPTNKRIRTDGRHAEEQVRHASGQIPGSTSMTRSQTPKNRSYHPVSSLPPGLKPCGYGHAGIPSVAGRFNAAAICLMPEGEFIRVF